MTAAIFHEQCAAELGIKEAIVTLASIHLGLPHELLVNVFLEVSIRLLLSAVCGKPKVSSVSVSQKMEPDSLEFSIPFSRFAVAFVKLSYWWLSG